MWAAPPVRGRGIGDAMIDSIARWAAGQGASKLALAVKADNARAIAFYRRLGFVDAAVSADDPSERSMAMTLPNR